MSGPIRAPLTVQTLDGSVSGRPITTIKVTNGDLTVSGNVATIDTSGGGGGGGMTSFDVAGNAGATQTIGNGDTFTLVGGSAGADIKVTMSATDTATIDLQTTGVTAASYSLASITVDANGRITAASSGSVSVPTGANPSATVSGSAVNGTATTFMRSDAAPALADTAVTPATYTYSTITVDAQGRITNASSGTAPTVDGSGAANQVAVWSDADTLTGYATMTFDGTDLTVEGNIKGGNVSIGNGTGEIETVDANDLILKTNNGTNSGTLSLKNGVGGNLIFTPTGTGALQLDGVSGGEDGRIILMCAEGTHSQTISAAPHASAATYELVLPTGLPADADNKYLVSDTSGNMSFTSASGGGGSSYNQARNPNGAIYTGLDINILTRGVGMTNVGALSNSVSTRSNYRQLMTRQFISPEIGTVSAFYAYCDTANSDTDIELAIYSDNGGKPYQLLGKGTIDCSSTGAKSQTSLSATISLTEGVQYWYSWVTTNSTGTPTLRAEDQATAQFTTGQTSSISTTDKSMYLIDISAGAQNTSPTEITASNLYPGGNSGGACRMGIKF